MLRLYRHVFGPIEVEKENPSQTPKPCDHRTLLPHPRGAPHGGHSALAQSVLLLRSPAVLLCLVVTLCMSSGMEPCSLLRINLGLGEC